MGGSDIERKFCKYWWDNLFRVVKEYRDVNLLVSDRNKLAVKIYRKCERAKK